MDRVWERDGRALRRVVVLLFALAQIADRAGSIPFPARVIVLAILRHAEGFAWAFAFGTASVPSARGRNHQPRQPVPPGALVAGHHGPADAVRLSHSLRALALIIAGWAIRTFSSTAVPSPLRQAVAPRRARHPRSWRGPAALPAPDTS